MATVNDWNKFINQVHGEALVEDDLRDVADNGTEDMVTLATRVLYEHFGVY